MEFGAVLQKMTLNDFSTRAVPIFISVLLFLRLCGSLEGSTTESNLLSRIRSSDVVVHDISDVSVYYSLKDNTTITKMMPRPWYFPGWPLRLPFVGEPCACSGLQCGCCAGVNIKQFNFNRKACANFTYDPNEFSINMDFNFNNNSILNNTISAKNPPPFCIPVPVPYIPVGVDFCIRLFEIYTPGQNLHMCMDFETRVDKAPVLILHFDCMKMGVDGVSLVKPDTGGQLATQMATLAPDPEQVDGDIFDSVEENKISGNNIMGSRDVIKPKTD